MNFLAIILAAATLVADPATQPTTQPATQPSRTIDSVRADLQRDRAALAAAQAARITRLHSTPEYSALADDAAKKAAALKAARLGVDAQAKLSASHDNVLAIQRLHKFDEMAVANDSKIAAADSQLNADAALLDDLQKTSAAEQAAKDIKANEEESKKEEERNALIAAAMRDGRLFRGMTQGEAMAVLNSIGTDAEKRTSTNADGITIEWDYSRPAPLSSGGVAASGTVYDRPVSGPRPMVVYRRVTVFLQNDAVIDFTDEAVN